MIKYCHVSRKKREAGDGTSNRGGPDGAGGDGTWKRGDRVIFDLARITALYIDWGPRYCAFPGLLQANEVELSN